MNQALVVTGAFLLVFLVMVMVLFVVAEARSKQARKTMASLEAVLRNEAPEARSSAAVNLRKIEDLSSIPWLNEQLGKMRVTPYLKSLLTQADSKWNPGTLLTLCGIALVVGSYLLYLRTDNFFLSIAIGVPTGLAPYFWVQFQRSRRFAKIELELPEVLDLIVNALRAGHSLVATMGLVARESRGPLANEFRICFEEQNFGLDMKVALEHMTERIPLQDLGIICTAIMIQRETGGNLAEVLEKTAHTIRERFRLRRMVQAQTSQGRFTGLVLSVLPVVLGLVFYIMSPKMVSVLWTTPLGVKMLWTATGMIVIGSLIVRKITNMKV